MRAEESRADHIARCEECRRTLYVWYLRDFGVLPLPEGRKDSLWTRIKHRLGRYNAFEQG